MTLGERIRLVRKKNDLTLGKFGDRIGISNVSVSRIESGTRNASDQTLKLICKEFGINYTWLTQEVGEMICTGTDEGNSLENSVKEFINSITSEQWQLLENIVKSIHNVSDR